MKIFWYIDEIRPIFTLFYVGAALVLFCLQESCCYVAILSMRALKPNFRFFPEAAYSCLIRDDQL